MEQGIVEKCFFIDVLSQSNVASSKLHLNYCKVASGASTQKMAPTASSNVRRFQSFKSGVHNLRRYSASTKIYGPCISENSFVCCMRILSIKDGQTDVWNCA